MDTYDVVIIGSGPGGYVAAIRSAQLGLSVALIEKYATLGGTCLNVGCIPSKALLSATESYYHALHTLPQMGFNLKGRPDFARLIEYKEKVVTKITSGVEFLMKKHKITIFHGVASFQDPHTVKVTNHQGKKAVIGGRHIIVATGSKPASLPSAPFDKKRIISSTEALSLVDLPHKMIIIGGGIIGVELGSVYARLGTQVVIFEYLDRLIPGMDDELARLLLRMLKKLGVQVELSHQVEEVKVIRGKKVKVKAQHRKRSGKVVTEEADYCLVAVGRRPYTDGLALEKAGLQTDTKGYIPVNEQLQTAQPHIYAIGDVIKGPMLAHKASEEGIFVAELIAGAPRRINHFLIPSVVYTHPELAAVGFTESELKAKGRAYRKGMFYMKGNGRAVASGEADGLVKVLVDDATDEIIGVHVAATRAADMIAEAVIAMEFRATADDVARMTFAHPTFSEAFKEAALDAGGRVIHA